MLAPMNTRRLLLRKPQLSDAEDLFAMLSDAETCRMDGNYPPYTAMDEAFYADVRAIVADGEDRLFAQDRTSGRMIAILHVMSGDTPRQAEIGFIVTRTVRRQGYAREAVSALLEQLAACGDYESVKATCYRDNLPCAALLLSLGFEEKPCAQADGSLPQRLFIKSLTSKGESHP